MYKVEQDVAKAIKNKENFRGGHSEVKFFNDSDYSVYRYGKEIVKFSDGILKIHWHDLIGSSLLGHFNKIAGDRFTIVNGIPHLDDKPISSNEWVTVTSEELR